MITPVDLISPAQLTWTLIQVLLMKSVGRYNISGGKDDKIKIYMFIKLKKCTKTFNDSSILYALQYSDVSKQD